jgi:hypothetical protein
MEEDQGKVEITSSSENMEPEKVTGIESGALAALKEYLDEVAPQTTVGPLVKFTKHGEYVKGAQAEKIAEGTAASIACDHAIVGFIMWVDGKPIHWVVMLSSGKPRYQRDELGYLDKTKWEIETNPQKDTPVDENGVPRRDPIKPIIYLIMMLEGGEVCTLSLPSKSGINSANQLIRRYANHVKRHPADYPRVKLVRGSYPHKDKTIGEVLYPDFEPAGWVNRAEFDQALQLLGIEFDQIECAKDTTMKQVKQAEKPALPKPKPTEKPKEKDKFGDEIPF